MDVVSPELDGFCVPESLGQVACRERKCVCVRAGESGFPLPVSQLADHQPDWPPPPMGPLPGGHINLVPCDSGRHIINIGWPSGAVTTASASVSGGSEFSVRTALMLGGSSNPGFDRGG